MKEEMNAGNEINLADFVAVLFRWKGFIGLMTIFFAVLALVASLVMTKKFEVSSILEIGQIRMEKDYRYVEAPEAAAERIKGIARRVFSQGTYKREAGFSVQNDFRVAFSKKSGIVETELQAPKGTAAIEFLQTVNDSFIRDHDRILQIEKQKIETDIESLSGQLDEYEGKKVSLNNRLMALAAEEQFLKGLIEKAGRQLDQILEIKLSANLENTGEPMGQLLFANEMQRIQAHRDELSVRLMSEIPEERENSFARIEEMDAGIRKVTGNLKMARVQMENIIATNVLLPPGFPDEPASPRMKLNVALGMVTGFLLSIFFSFVLDFWRENKNRIKAG